MSTRLKLVSSLLITMSAAVGMAQYVDRFDGSTSSNWARETLLDHGSAEWSVSSGRMNFFSGNSPTGDDQVFLKLQQPFSNSQDWSFQIGMNNGSTAQLQVFVGNNDYSDYFGVTLKGYSDGSKVWGAEFPGHQYWVPPNGITATASQQGSIKVDYKASTSTYSLLYANGGMDPISNNYSYSLLNSYTSSEKGNVSLFVGMNTSAGVTSGQVFVDNLKTIPEPSPALLLWLGAACFIGVKRLRKNKDKMLWLIMCSGLMLCNNQAHSTTYFSISPNLSHQLVEVTSAFVPYSYKISQNMTSQSDWLVFLNAKAKTSDPYGLYKAGDFSRTLSNGEYTYSLLNSGAGSQPVRGVNLYDAYRYANWVENGANNSSDTETGSYNLIGLNIKNDNLANRATSAHFFIQTNDEWQRSLDVINTSVGYDEWTDTHSYYNNGALIVHNDVPAGLASQISVYADGPQRAGGFGGADISFRIVSVPEPSALSLLAVGLVGLAILRRGRKED